MLALTDYLQHHPDQAITTTLADWLTLIEQQLQANYLQDDDIRAMILNRSHAIDDVLKALWQWSGLTAFPVALFAVGGYGRQEQFPYSDVDIMVFVEHELTEEMENALSQFVSSLWDLKQFKPAVSVRTLQQCMDTAKQDITIATSLIEARLVFGATELASYPRQIVAQTWTDQTFFDAKMQEQEQRHSQHRLNSVEPDIKQSVGGLRDIHQIGWIAKRHFRVNRIYDLTHLGFLSEFELQTLEQAERFLWKIRHHLHLLTKRDDNRLLFDYQREIAKEFGFISQPDRPRNEAIELFMKQYYRIAQQVSTLNEMLLTYFHESVVIPRLPNYQRQIVEINEHFKLVDGRLAVQHHKVFAESPKAILELFNLWATRHDILGIRARTLRLLLLASNTIDDKFRENPEHHALFLNILRSDAKRLYSLLVAMKRYGVLGRYIPAFGKITGLMQYDLFHIYTVDAHTLLLIRNLRRFNTEEFSEQFPVVSAVYQQLPRYDLLYLSAFFHDIAKGRNGDHSILGAEDALEFCRLHGLSEDDAQFVAWLIRYHLLMSVTAQKKDISDPEVVQEFAKKVGTIRKLDYLYCLTVADMNATNPKLWNSWRASLMRQLYLQTKELIEMGVEQPIDPQSLIAETKLMALQDLMQDFPSTEIEQLWQELGDDYFLKNSADNVVWHSKAILQHGTKTEPLILMKAHQHEQVKQADAVEIFIYTPDQPNLFAKTVMVLDRMDLDVQHATIITANKGFSLDSYVVLDRYATLVHDVGRMDEVKQALIKILIQPDVRPNVKQRRIPRQLRHFNVATQVNTHFDETLQQNVIDIITLDQPGLLAKMGSIFMQYGLEIHSARIATFGERAEDIFFITYPQSKPLTHQQALDFAEQLKIALDEFSQQLQQG